MLIYLTEVFLKFGAFVCFSGQKAHIPCDHHIFPIRLGLKSFDNTQLDLGLSFSVKLHFIRKQAHLSGQTINWFRNAGTRNHYVTVEDFKKITHIFT